MVHVQAGGDLVGLIRKGDNPSRQCNLSGVGLEPRHLAFTVTQHPRRMALTRSGLQSVPTWFEQVPARKLRSTFRELSGRVHLDRRYRAVAAVA